MYSEFFHLNIGVMKVLLSGSSGFLGGYILSHLNRTGTEVITVGRSATNAILCDLKTEVPMIDVYHEFGLIIHSAGLAHRVPKKEAEGKLFFDVNVGGTKNLLEGLVVLKKKPRCFVFVSTVAVYGVEEGLGIDETHKLNGISPYALSKIEAEKLVQDWCDMHGVNCVILRLPLVIGDNAPGNLGAMERAIRKGYYFRLGSGNARRSMVNAEDVARLMPLLIDQHGIYNLTDGKHLCYCEFDVLLAKKYSKNIRSIPKYLGKFLALIGDVFVFFPLNSYRLNKLEASFTVSDSKARIELGWAEEN